MNELVDGSRPVAPTGSSTLARGLQALLLVADSKRGIAATEAARSLGVHRSVAARVLRTLADFQLVHPAGATTGYVPAARLATFANTRGPALAALLSDDLQSAADKLAATVCLFGRLGDQAVALAVTTPRTVEHHVAFAVGGRTDISSGAAGHVLQTVDLSAPANPPAVERARSHGFAVSSGEVEEGAHAVAFLVSDGRRPAHALCLAALTLTPESAEALVPQMSEVAGLVRNRLIATQSVWPRPVTHID